MNTTTPIRLLIADDHLVVRAGLAALLSTQADFEVLGDADTGEKALALTAEHQPHVLLLDLEMPDMDGVSVIQRLQTAVFCPRILVFTAFDTDERIIGAVQAGAHGYLLKGAPREELFNAIRVLHGGGSLLQPIVAAKLMKQMQTPPQPENEPLTPRELDVLRQLAQGLQNKEIATALHITERTVKFH